MTRHTRLLLAAVTALLVLALASNAATAFEQTFTSAEVTFSAGATEVTCELTLRGTFVEWHELPIEGRRAGAINSASSRNCNNGAALAFLNLSWEMTELEVEGTLPNLTEIAVTISNFSINFPLFGGFINCLYQGNARMIIPIIQLENGDNGFEAAVFDESVEIPKHSGAFCPSSMSPTGTFAMSPLVPIEII